MNAPDAPGAETLDAFHRGAFWLVQPKTGGHRAGTDAMMLAGAVPSSFAGRLADLGAGAGAAGLAVASRCKGAQVLLVERSPAMAAFARRTLAHPNNAHLAPRIEVLEADVTLVGRAREAAGLAPGSVDWAILNPPFNRAGDRASPDALRREAHVMDDDLWERWLRTAASIVRPRGGLALIARPESLPAVLAALGSRFGAAELLAIHPQADAPAIRIVLRARRGSRQKLALQPPLHLHEGPGHGFSPRAEAINNGLASLFGD